LRILLANINILKDQTKSMGSLCFKISFNRIANSMSSWKTLTLFLQFSSVTTF